MTGFYKGLMANLAKGVPQRGIYFYCYEAFKKFLCSSSPPAKQWVNYSIIDGRQLKDFVIFIVYDLYFICFHIVISAWLKMLGKNKLKLIKLLNLLNHQEGEILHLGWKTKYNKTSQHNKRLILHKLLRLSQPHHWLSQ